MTSNHLNLENGGGPEAESDSGVPCVVPEKTPARGLFAEGDAHLSVLRLKPHLQLGGRKKKRTVWNPNLHGSHAHVGVVKPDLRPNRTCVDLGTLGASGQADQA